MLPDDHVAYRWLDLEGSFRPGLGEALTNNRESQRTDEEPIADRAAGHRMTEPDWRPALDPVAHGRTTRRRDVDDELAALDVEHVALEGALPRGESVSRSTCLRSCWRRGARGQPTSANGVGTASNVLVDNAVTKRRTWGGAGLAPPREWAGT